LTGADAGVIVHDGLHVLQVGESMDFARRPFDYHPVFNIAPGEPRRASSARLRFVFYDAAGTYADSAEVSVVFTPAGCPADLGRQGGGPGADGQLDNNDFIVFISAFFNAEPIADRGIQGGEPGSDGAFDNNDFIVFISQFFRLGADRRGAADWMRITAAAQGPEEARTAASPCRGRGEWVRAPSAAC